MADDTPDTSTVPAAPADSTAPGGGSPPALPDADLWDHYVTNGIPKDTATNLVKLRGALSPADTWDHLVSNGMPQDSATVLAPLATGRPAQSGTTPGALDTGLTHAGVSATYGLAKDILPAAMAGIERIPGVYKLFKDPQGNVRTAPAGYDELKREFSGELASGAAAHPIAAATGDVAGAVLSPLNALVGAPADLIPGSNILARVARGAVAGGLGAGAYTAGTADGTLGQRLAQGAGAVPTGAAVGGVLGPIAEKIAERWAPNTEVTAQLAQAEQAAKAASQPFYAAADPQPIQNPEVAASLDIPEFQDAYKDGRAIEMAKPPSQRSRAAGAPPTLPKGAPVQIDPRYLTGNPEIDGRMQAAAQSAAGPARQPLTVRDFDLMRQGMPDILQKLSRQGEMGDRRAGQLRQTLDYLTGLVDQEQPLYAKARQTYQNVFANRAAAQSLTDQAANSAAGNAVQAATDAAYAKFSPMAAGRTLGRVGQFFTGRPGDLDPRALVALVAARRAAASQNPATGLLMGSGGAARSGVLAALIRASQAVPAAANVQPAAQP